MVREQRREQVLDAAKAVFAKKGFHRSSIADIIQRAGIARGTFYLYFKNKRDIFDCLLDSLLEQVDQRIPTIEVGKGKPPPLEQLKTNLTRVTTLSLEEPALIQILFHHAMGLDKELDRKVQAFYEMLRGRIEGALTLGIKIGLVRPCPSQLVAYGVLGAMKEVMGQLASNRIAPPDLKTVVEGLLEFGLHGVLVEPFEG